MSNSTPGKRKRYQDMTLDEVRAATKEFDAEHAGTPGRPLTPSMKVRNAKAVKAAKAIARKRGRPRVGKGAASVMVSLERGLLAKADALAEAQGMSRSEMIAQGLLLLMNAPRNASATKRSARRKAS
jgi:hypothetical protein